jgi:hypothetical protein
MKGLFVDSFTDDYVGRGYGETGHLVGAGPNFSSTGVSVVGILSCKGVPDVMR